MGNTELKTAFKNAIKDQQARDKLGLTAEILLEDQLVNSVEEFIKEKMNVGTLEKSKAFPENNIQENENAEELYKKQLISELNENYISGFATAESSIEYLKEPSFEKYFTVNSPETTQEYTKLQQQKFVILYALFIEKYKEQQDKKQNFFEYIQRFLEQQDVNQRVQVGLESGFKFSLSLLKEIKSINKDMLVNSLEYLYQTLRHAEPGSLYSTDKLSFMIDSNLNDARSFLVNIIEDSSSQPRAVELCYKILFLLGQVRSNVEDHLLVSTLLDKHRSKVDLRTELDLIKGEDNIQTDNLSKQNFSERKITKQGVIFYLKTGSNKQDIKKNASFTTDGQFVYMHQEGLGLLRLGTGSAGQMIGQVYQHNLEFKKEEDVSLLALNGKLYCRADSIKPKPFVGINPQTLEEIKEETEIEKEEKNLEWKTNEETGRSLNYTPLISDGTYIYVIAQKKAPKKKNDEDQEHNEDEEEDKKKPPMLVLECYDPNTPTFKFVNEVYLYKNENFEPFIKNENSITFLKESSFATNGSLLVIQHTHKNKSYFFNLKTGIRIQKATVQNAELENSKVCYDNVNNTFYNFKLESQDVKMQSFSIINFKKAGAASGFAKEYLSKRISSIRKTIMGEGQKRETSDEDDQDENLNVISRIMKNVTTPVMIEQSRQPFHVEYKGDQLPQLLRCLILRHIEKSCQGFTTTLEEIQSQGKGSDSDQHIMKFFKYPNATYLTHTLFQIMLENLQNSQGLINQKKEMKNLPDQYSFYFILKILTANFQALSFCSISLPEIMKKDVYRQFLDVYKSCIVKIIEDGYNSDFEQCEHTNEMKELWGEIHKICLNILSTSINLIYSDNKEIIENLQKSLSNKGDKKQSQNSSISLNFLSMPENSKRILQSDPDVLELIINVYKECCETRSTSIIEIIKQNQLGKVIEKQDEESILSQASNKFIRGFSEQLIVSYCTLAESLAAKQQVSSGQVTEKDEQDKQRMKAYDRLLTFVFEQNSISIINIIKSLVSSLSTNLSQRGEDQWEGITEAYEKYSSFMDQILQHNSGFFSIMTLYVQTFSIFKLKTNLLPQVTQSTINVIKELSTFFKIIQDYQKKIEVEEDKDRLKKFLNTFSRNLCWYVGMTAYKLIKVKEVEKESDKKDKESPHEKMQELIIQSNLLSGGIENKFITLFSNDTQNKLQDLIKISHDQRLQELLQNSIKQEEEDQIVSSIIHEGKDEKVDRMITFLQKQLEAKRPFVAYAKLSGADGMRLSRAAFAVMIKFSEYFDHFLLILDEIDMLYEENKDSSERDQIIKNHLKEQSAFEQIQKRWESASKMRQWINEKKKNLIEKVKKQVEIEFKKKNDEEKAKQEELKKKEEEKKEDKKQEETEQIDTSSKKETDDKEMSSEKQKQEGFTEDEKLQIEEITDKKFDVELQKIFDKIIEKADFLIKLQVPVAYLVKDPTKKKEGALLFIREQSSHDAQVDHEHEFDWKDRLKSWRQMQTSKGAIKSFTDRKKEIFDSSVMSTLACLQTPITAQRIKKQVETVFLNASKRVAGLRILGQVIGIELPQNQKFDLINWFAASLRGNKNQMSHYLDDLKGCGQHLEEEARENFFQILKGLVAQLKNCDDEKEIKVIINALKWKFLARDHLSLNKLEIFKVLHQGNGDKKNKLKKAWGRPLKQVVINNENDKKLTKEVIDLFEQVFLLTVGRIIKPDTGALMKLKQRGTSVPTLEKAQSVIDENISEKLISQAIEVIFGEFRRYIKIMKMFKGVDWTIYVKMRNKERKNNEEKKSYEDENLLDEEDDEQEEKKDETQNKSEKESKEEKDKEKNEEKKEDKDEKKEEGEEGEEGEDQEEQDQEEKEKQEAIKKQEERAEKEMKYIHKLYSESFLRRLLRLVEIFTSIATVSPYPLSMVQRVANPYQLETLLNLLILSSPRIKIVVLKIIQNLIKIAIPFEVFEETIKIITKDTNSQAYEILNKVVPSVQFEESMFLKFLYNYLLSIRHKMWTKSGIESEGQYAISCELLRTLRFIYESQISESHPYRKTINKVLNTFLLDFKSINKPKEAELLFGLLRGCDFIGLAPYMTAVTSNREKLSITGFVNRNWLTREASDSQEISKVHDDFASKDLRVLTVQYNDKHREKCEFQLYDPNDIKVLSDPSPTLANLNLYKNQFQLTSNILNQLFQDSDLLSSVDEDDVGNKQLDIFTLNNRTIIMKMISYQLQSNSYKFLKELRSSNYYQSLLKFVCKESSQEMKGEIMLLEWLEQRCFTLRKYACENQESLVKQREVHVTLVKDKIYVSFQHPQLKSEKQMNGIQLKSALNFKNFEEKKDVKLVHMNDVYVGEQTYSTKQIVLIDKTTIEQNGMDILNSCQGAITYGVDLNKISKLMFAKQREDIDKYLGLSQKTIFLVSENDYKKICQLIQSSSFKKSQTKQFNQKQLSQQEDSPDQQIVNELIQYGGFDKKLAVKTIEKEDIEKKTVYLTQLCKQVKDGILEIEQLPSPDKKKDEEQSQDSYLDLQSKASKKRTEEKSQSLQYLKTGFFQTIDRAHPDQQEKSSKEMLYDTISNISKKDLAIDYEKSLIRLFNMYCRQVFWSLIQKDDIERIFTMVIENQEDMRSFSVYLKVLGNECFITGNKVYIKGYKQFLKKVVQVCCKNEKFKPLINIIIKEGLMQPYSELFKEFAIDGQELVNNRIEDYFKTESKAAQLMNPFIIVPLLKEVINEDATIFESYVDDLVNALISINCIFIGNYKLKKNTWSLIVAILEKVRERVHQIPRDTIQSLLRSHLIEHLFNGFENHNIYEFEEGIYAKRLLRENNSNEIDGISRRDVEKLVYAKRIVTFQHYMKFQTKQEQSKILIEMLFKLYLIDKESNEDGFFYKTNLMVYLNLFTNILKEGKNGKLLEYLLFCDKLETQNKIITHMVETHHKEYEKGFTSKVSYQQAEKILVKFNESTKMRPGAAVVLSSDVEGKNPQAIVLESQIRKEQALYNIYGSTFYMHYPVYPSVIYHFSMNEDSPLPAPIQYPLYRPLERFEDQSVGTFFVTKGNKIFVSRGEDFIRYQDHLDIQQITFGKQCRVMLLKNGKVWAGGRNKKDIRGQEIPFFEKNDKIKQIATFFQVTIGVSEKGKVFAVGDKIAKILKLDKPKFGFFEIPLSEKLQEEEQQKQKQKDEQNEEQKAEVQEEQKKENSPDQQTQQIDTTTQNQQPELRAVKVWTCKSSLSTEQVYMCLVENLTSNTSELRTIGINNFGLLGQGKDNTEARVFKKLLLEQQIKSSDHVYANAFDYVMLIGQDDKVYAWGCYNRENEERTVYQPTVVPFFDNYNIHMLAAGTKTVALASHKETPDKRIIIYGKFMPLWNENSYKTINFFSDFNIYNIQPYSDRIYISTIGNYQYQKPIPNQYQHEQKCESCSEQIQGILHFFKDKEQRKLHYYCVKCVQNEQMAQKYQPDLVWAVKRPITNIEDKEIPEIDSQQLLTEENRGTPQYVTRYKINGKEQQHSFTLDDILLPQQEDINPMVYLRISRPLRQDTQIPMININKFYEQTNHFGISMNVTPDYSFQQSEELITKNQPVYDEFQKALQEIQSLDKELTKEFYSKIENLINKKLKDQSISELKLEDIVIEEELKFSQDQLNNLSENCKKYHLGKFLLYCKYVWASFSYIIKYVKNKDDFSLLTVFDQNRNTIPLMLKNKLLRRYVEHLPVDDRAVSIHVNRKKAKEFEELGKVDEKGENSIFGQVQRGLAAHRYQGMRINSSDKKAWFVKFIGEFALDQGGLFRESLTELCQELQSSTLNILVPTQNQKNNYGENRDKWVINPAASSPSQLKMFEFLGTLIGMSVRSGILMNLSFPSFLWKQLTDERLILKDLNEIDTMTMNVLEEIKDIQSKMSEEQFMAGYELTFTTILSNGEEIELIPGGKQVKVTYSNMSEFINKTIYARFSECKKQIKAIKRGIKETFDDQILRLLSWKDLEYKVVGKEAIDVERLKEITAYRNCSESSETIKKFWKIMSTLSNEQKKQYLRFVWGRTRLPLKEEEVTENHTIQLDEEGAQDKLPIGRTCFFRLEIPPYKNEDVFKEKLLYAIQHCTAIDADIEGAVHEEEEPIPEVNRSSQESENQRRQDEELFEEYYDEVIEEEEE